MISTAIPAATEPPPDVMIGSTDEPPVNMPSLIAPQHIRAMPQPGRLTITWNNTEEAVWYNVVIMNELHQAVWDQWFTKPGANLSASYPTLQIDCHLTCTASLNVDLQAGTYTVWMQAWATSADSLSTISSSNSYFSNYGGNGERIGLSAGWNSSAPFIYSEERSGWSHR